MQVRDSGTAFVRSGGCELWSDSEFILKGRWQNLWIELMSFLREKESRIPPKIF